MAKFDYGGGCPCGLYRECPPSCRHYVPPRTPEGTKRVPPKEEPKEEPNAALREIAGRIKRLTYRDLIRLVDALHDNIPGALSSSREGVVEGVLAAADKLETA